MACSIIYDIVPIIRLYNMISRAGLLSETQIGWSVLNSSFLLVYNKYRFLFNKKNYFLAFFTILKNWATLGSISYSRNYTQ